MPSTTNILYLISKEALIFGFDSRQSLFSNGSPAGAGIRPGDMADSPFFGIELGIFDKEGIVAVLSCSNEDCRTHAEFYQGLNKEDEMI